MSFGSTNAPSTFQVLMNYTFKPFPIHFLLVFFDDILIYKKYCENHVQYVDMVLKQLKDQALEVFL